MAATSASTSAPGPCTHGRVRPGLDELDGLEEREPSWARSDRSQPGAHLAHDDLVDERLIAGLEDLTRCRSTASGRPRRMVDDERGVEQEPHVGVVLRGRSPRRASSGPTRRRPRTCASGGSPRWRASPRPARPRCPELLTPDGPPQRLLGEGAAVALGRPPRRAAPTRSSAGSGSRGPPGRSGLGS